MGIEDRRPGWSADALEEAGRVQEAMESPPEAPYGIPRRWLQPMAAKLATAVAVGEEEMAQYSAQWVDLSDMEDGEIAEELVRSGLTCRFALTRHVSPPESHVRRVLDIAARLVEAAMGSSLERGHLGSMEEEGVEESGRVVSGVKAGGTGEHGAPMLEGEEDGSPKCYPPAPSGLSSEDADRGTPQELTPPHEEEMGTEAVEDGSEKCYPPGQMERPWMEA